MVLIFIISYCHKICSNQWHKFPPYNQWSALSNRQMILKVEAQKEERTILVVGGRDTDGLPFSFFKEVPATCHAVASNLN